MTDGNELRSRLRHCGHRRLYDYWRSKSPPGGLPGRQHIDPMEIPALLSRINLVEVAREHGRPRFRHRLIGTQLVEKVKRDATGQWFEQVYDAETLRSIVEHYAQVIESKRPALWRAPAHAGNREFLTFERLILPLAADGETVDMLLVMFVDDDEGDSAQ